jgi:L-iditol 2-dehydrogenase
MKAVVKYAPGEGKVDVLDVEEPVCGDHQIKLEVGYCGVCGTDIHVWHDTFKNYPPVILGHEFSGVVVEVGRSVSGVKVGDRGAGLGATAVTCGKCDYCRTGYFIHCSNRRGMGHGVNGALTRYVLLRPDQLYRVPEIFSLEEAALSEPFAAAVQAVTEVTSIRLGDVALVSGPGPIGLLCLKLLVAEGVKTIVAGAAGDDARLEAAKRIGAATVVNVTQANLTEVVREETRGKGVDVGFECAGHPGSVRGCLQSLRPRGQYTQIGICGRDIEFPIDQLFYKQLTMRGSVCYTAGTWDRMMKMFEQGRIRLSDLVSTKLPILEWRKAFDLCMDKKALKVLMYPVES